MIKHGDCSDLQEPGMTENINYSLLTHSHSDTHTCTHTQNKNKNVKKSKNLVGTGYLCNYLASPANVIPLLYLIGSPNSKLSVWTLRLARYKPTSKHKAYVASESSRHNEEWWSLYININVDQSVLSKQIIIVFRAGGVGTVFTRTYDGNAMLFDRCRGDINC